MNVCVSGLHPLRRTAAVCLGIALSAPLYAAQPPRGEAASPPAGKEASVGSLPLQPAVTVPGGNTQSAPALTPEQYNEMLETLRVQVAQQRALLQVLAQHTGTLPEAPEVPGDAAAATPDTPSTPSDGAQPATAGGSQGATAPASVTPDVPGKAASPDKPAAPGADGPSPEPAVAPSSTSSPAPAATNVVPATPPAQADAPAPPSPAVSEPAGIADTQTSRQAYASGVSVWREIQNSVAMQEALGIKLDPQQVLEGLEDSAKGRPLRLSEQAITDAMSSLNVDYQRRATEERKRQETEGKAYRIAFSKEKGAFSDAGAWYQIVSKGSGKRLSVNDMVLIRVTGTLPDGSVFDGSGESGQVRRVKVGALLPSVAIGLQKISAGGHIKVVVPPAKGYGDTGLPPAIPGGATLIFDIEAQGLAQGGGDL